MAARDFTATMLVLAVASSWLWPGSEATNYTVGGSVGWKVPPTGTKLSDWASKYTFKVGDILIFNFTTGIHDVAVVTKDNYDACNLSSSLEILSTGPASYSLDKDGEYYYICTFSNHCSRGQKLEITVGDSSSGPTSSPSPSDGKAPLPSSPPPTNFASALSATSMPVMASIIAGLWLMYFVM
ncbi:hypothetical protein MLD38_014412 [Melastoma candidum]|uniref:Uncharacterized protein n=1 Tax=Melastoma candidum TaxID=119954 RepID=A0ACB9RCN6_9MYRT|nr:hypothetical protein MLD38_014412 [Melastoma candidum]